MSKMGAKYWLIFLMLAMAMVVGSTSPFDDTANWGVNAFGRVNNNGFDMETEMMLDSEINHRLLAQRSRYIGYGALKKNAVPCNRRGSSYYNCNSRQKANPYKRGCSAITRCKRRTR